jgi:hypothetical protein
MEFQTVKAFQRVVHRKVDGQEALALRSAGKTLAEIRAALAPGVSLSTVSRAIERAKAGN